MVLEVNPNTPEIQERAQKLAHGLIDRVPIGEAIGVLLVATEAVLVAVLHQESPLCEANIACVEQLLDTLRSNVMNHADCAKTINRVPEPGTEQIH